MRHWQHTRALARAGHDVTVVTSYVQHKERTVPERYRGRKMVHEVEDGIDVWRTYSTPGYGRDLQHLVISAVENGGGSAGGINLQQVPAYLQPLADAAGAAFLAGLRASLVVSAVIVAAAAVFAWVARERQDTSTGATSAGSAPPSTASSGSA